MTPRPPRPTLFPYTTLFRSDSIKYATSILDYVFRELAVSYLSRFDLAHVEPSDTGFDALGRGVEEGKPAPSPSKYVSKGLDRKSTRLNSSHSSLSYAVFCSK